MEGAAGGDGGLDAQVDSALGSRESSQQRSEGEVAVVGEPAPVDAKVPDPSHEPCEVNVKIADLGNACWTVSQRKKILPFSRHLITFFF